MIVLLDIDGTILSTGGAGRRAMRVALIEYAEGGEVPEFSFAGMTDFGIVRESLSAAGAPSGQDRIDAVLARYVDILAAQIDADEVTVFPGVRELIARLGSEPGLGLGLGTGNIERGARIKLGSVGLSDPFSFGGFGDDAEERALLVAAGARRGAASLGVALEDERVVVVGDTVRDAQAARDNGFECVLVATGEPSRDSLQEASPDLLVDTLEDERVLRFILDGA